MTKFIVTTDFALNNSSTVGSASRSLYLGENFLAAEKLGISGLGPLFHKTSEEIAYEFLEFSSELNRKNQSLTYWGTPLASRNTFSNPLFFNLVSLVSVRRIIESKKIVPDLIVCDSPALAKILRQFLGGDWRLKLSLRDTFLPGINFLKTRIKAIRFLLRSTALCLFTQTLKNQRISEASKNIFILRTWVTGSCIDSNGNYKNRNFGGLGQYLESKGKDPWVLPMFFDLPRSIFSQIKMMSQLSQKFIFHEQYLKPSDYLGIVRRHFKEWNRSFKGYFFEGFDVSAILIEIHQTKSFYSQLLDLNSVWDLLRVLGGQGIEPEALYYPIEMNFMENTLNLACKAFLPKTIAAGFQHTVWFKGQWGMFLSGSESKFHPQPDEIICSGKEYRRIFKEAGITKPTLRLGCNLRFTDVNQSGHDVRPSQEKGGLFDDSKSTSANDFRSTHPLANGLTGGIFSNFPNSTSNNSQGHGSSYKMKNILVLLHQYEQLSFQTLHWLSHFSRNGKPATTVEKFRYILKPHPSLNLDQLKGLCQKFGFKNCEWAMGNVHDALKNCDVVVMSAASVSYLEVLAEGKPIISLKLDNVVQFDPLFEKYPIRPAESVDDLKTLLNFALNLSSSTRHELAEFGKSIKEKYFEPVSGERMKEFLLPPEKPNPRRTPHFESQSEANL